MNEQGREKVRAIREALVEILTCGDWDYGMAPFLDRLDASDDGNGGHNGDDGEGDEENEGTQHKKATSYHQGKAISIWSGPQGPKAPYIYVLVILL